MGRAKKGATIKKEQLIKVTNASLLHSDIETIYQKLNKDFFDSKLITPIINIIPSSRDSFASVAFDVKWIFQNRFSRSVEMNISTCTIELPMLYLCAELLHVMCHIYCYQNEIKDTSNQMIYHNKQFKKCAELHGLDCKKGKYGWDKTLPNEKLIKWVGENHLEDIKIYRDTSVELFDVDIDENKQLHTNMVKITNKTSSIKWVCPVCGNIARTTSNFVLLCGGKRIPHESTRMIRCDKTLGNMCSHYIEEMNELSD